MSDEPIDSSIFNIASIGVTSLFDNRTFGLCYGCIPHVRLSLPPMVAPFPVSEYNNANRKTTFSLTLGFHGMNSKPEVEQVKRLFEALDDLMIEFAIKHRDVWFKNPLLSRQQLKEMYKPILKPSNNPNYPPSIRIKLKQHDNQITSNVSYVKNNGAVSKFDLKELAPGSSMSVNIKLSNIWIVNKTFGISLEGEDLFVHEPKLEKISKPSYLFIQDE
jgi:hypothetical protein